MSEQSLKNKTIKGITWSGIDNVAQYAVSFVVSIVLARLLSPDDYGLLGIIAIFTAICTAIISGGFNSALMRKKNVSEDDYSTAFLINFGASIFLYIIIFLLASFIAYFFNRQELVNLIRVTSLGLILGAMIFVPQARLAIQLDFKTQTKVSFIASISSGIIGILMALSGCGVWSLVAQSLSLQLFKILLFYYYCKWIPLFRFSSVSFHELFGFGWKIMLSNLLDTVWKELYQVVVGKIYTPATLGQYTRAKGFAQLFSTNLTMIIQRVTYPVLSSIQDEKERLIFAYRRIIKTTMFITAVSMLFLGAISEPLLYCLIGPKWHEAATYLPLICISSSLYPLNAINLNMLQVQGRSDLFLGLEVTKKIIGVLPLYVCFKYGVISMLYVNLFTGIISYILNSYYSGKSIGYNVKMQVKDIIPSYLVAIVIAITVYFFKYLPFSNWLILPMQMAVGILMFVIICESIQFKEYIELKQFAQPFFQKIKINKLRK